MLAIYSGNIALLSSHIAIAMATKFFFYDQFSIYMHYIKLFLLILLQLGLLINVYKQMTNFKIFIEPFSIFTCISVPNFTIRYLYCFRKVNYYKDVIIQMYISGIIPAAYMKYTSSYISN